MELTDNQDFLRWAGRHGLGLHPEYTELLAFVPERGDSRFWPTQYDRDERLAMLTVCLDALDPWESCWVYKRQGTWTFVREDRPFPTDIALEAINRWIDIPEGHAGSVRFDAADRAALTLLLMLVTEWGSNIHYDLYIVPDHAEQFLWLDHDEALWVFFADAGRVEPLVGRMAAAGFDLPTKPPNRAILWQPWMEPEQQNR